MTYPGVPVTVCAALNDIDARIRLAVAERDKRLAACRHSWNADTAKALSNARRELDLQLEERFRAQ